MGRMKESLHDRIVVAYHENCYDGFGAAFAAWKALGDSATYVAVGHGKPPPEKLEDSDVLYLLDFAYPKDILLQLAEERQVIVLDHHKTAQQDLSEVSHANMKVYFDMARSGAGMAWDYFHPGKSRPHLISFIQDRDLWKNELRGSGEVHAALTSYPFDFKVWNELIVVNLMIEGEHILRMRNQLVSNICDKVWLEEVGGYLVPVVNTATAWSDVGACLLSRFPEAKFVACFTVCQDHVMWSLRSKNEFDVSEVATKLGGGGHKNAAGFKTFLTRGEPCRK